MREYAAIGIGTLLALALLSGPRLAVAQRPGSPCLRYESDTVALAGTLRRETFPGPPNFESVGRGDRPETGYYLHLASPVCTVADSNNDAVPGARLVQLVLDSAGYARLRPRLGRRVQLRGILFAAMSGHHHAPVVMRVLEPAAER